MKLLGSPFERNINEILMTYLPSYYQESKVVNSMIKVDSNELEEFHKRITDVLDQFAVDTATWGLDIWEKELGLKTSVLDSLEERRTRIKAKLIGEGTFTKAKAISLANNYLKNPSAKFVSNYKDYSFSIRYNLDDLIDISKMIHSFEELKPAHLAMFFEGMIYDKIIISFTSYHFGVKYKITNTFKTDSKKGVLGKGHISVIPKIYNFTSFLPVCNTFTTSTITNENTTFDILFDSAYKKNDVLFKRAGEETTTTGEGSI